jgi:hypothetical protein
MVNIKDVEYDEVHGYGDFSNGFCDECGEEIEDAEFGPRVCSADESHDCYGDNFNNGGDPYPEGPYTIYRFYHDGRDREVIGTDYTKEEAIAHCTSEDTHGDGWFDGYEKED